jgi:hypothetical protein
MERHSAFRPTPEGQPRGEIFLKPTSFVGRFLPTEMLADSFTSRAERDNSFIPPEPGILGFKLNQLAFQVPHLAFESDLSLRAAAVLASAHCLLHTPPSSVDGEIPLCS